MGIPFSLYWSDYKKPASLSPHYHAFPEIVAMKSGEVDIVQNGAERRLLGGDIYVINAESVHFARAQKGETLAAVIKLDPALVSLWGQKPGARFAVGGGEEGATYREDLAATIEEICGYYRGRDPLRIPTLDTLGNMMMRLLVLRFKEGEKSARENTRFLKLKKMLAFIKKNYKSDIGLPDLVKETGLSKEHISRMFAAEIGMNFSEVLLNRRLEGSHADILKPGLPLKEIAFANGFSSYSYFVENFRDRYGMNPAKLRELASKTARKGDAVDIYRNNSAPKRR